MITENLSTLKIHKLTQEQYDRELAAGRIDETAIYLTPAQDEVVSEEIDPTVPAWAKEPTKPSYTANEVGAYQSRFRPKWPKFLPDILPDRNFYLPRFCQKFW